MNALPEAILARLNNLIVVVSPDGDIEYVNPAVQTILGFEPPELLGGGWWELTRETPADSFAARREIRAMQNKSLSFERKLLDASGEEKWILFNTSAGPGGRLIGIGYDITGRKKAEELLNSRNAELEKRNDEITESIRYAGRIQQAMLPAPGKLDGFLNEASVFYRPKDIVGGDFYWVEENNSYAWAAVGDCTGHGVPGALMSVMGGKLIRDAVLKLKLSDPADVLRYIDEELKETLQAASGTPDGLDLALVRFDKVTRSLSFAGAFRPLWIIRNGKLLEFAGSRYPLGFYQDAVKTFDTLELQMEAGDRVILFSDGFPDQFGGEENRKFNRKRFRELAGIVAELQAEETEGYLDYVLKNWKQDQEQTDDITLLTFRIP